MDSKVAWTTYSLGNSLMTVGSEALCTLYDNILVFFDLNTKNMSYYKAESSSQGHSISAVTGHNRFPMVAFSEVILRPSIHIIQYPSFQTFEVFQNDDVVCFVDIRFNDHDFVVALTGFPNFTICVWNFRTGNLILKKDTNKACVKYSLLMSYHYVPNIIQYSEGNQCIMVWEIVQTAKSTELHKTSRIQLEKTFSLCDINSAAFSEDNILYLVDNFGTVSLIRTARFYLKEIWALEASQRKPSPHHYYLCWYKQSLLVYCHKEIHCIRKHANVWITEWTLDYNIPPGGVYKIVCNVLGDVYTSEALGNLYKLNITEDKIEMQELFTFNKKCIGFADILGAHEECVVLLTPDCHLIAVNLDAIEIFSDIEIPDANTIVSHNSNPCVVVGTTTGKIHFIKYNNVHEPFEVGNFQTSKGFPIGAIVIHDALAAYCDIYYGFIFFYADFVNEKFDEVAPIFQMPENVIVLNFFMKQRNVIYIFVTQDEKEELPHTRELWTFKYSPQSSEVTCRKYILPYVYRDITAMNISSRETVEFIGARMGTNIIDLLHLSQTTHELSLFCSQRTRHMANINGLVGSKNLLTWAVDGTAYHLRSHKKSHSLYGMSQMLQIKYRPRVVSRVQECHNAKYLIFMYSNGGLKVMKVPTHEKNLVENHNIIYEEEHVPIEPYDTAVRAFSSITTEEVIYHSPEELKARDDLLHRIHEFSKEVKDLIDYDISVTGKTQGVFKKFCLNHVWLEELTKESRRLCEAEGSALESATKDQARVRDYIRGLILANTENITYKIRAIFSNFSFENFGQRYPNDCFSKFYELYRLYEIPDLDEESEDDEEEVNEVHTEEDRTEDSSQDNQQKVQKKVKRRQYFTVQGTTYDHILSDDLALQDIETVTGNQMYNQDAKIRILLTDHLKSEFNRKFDETRKIKVDLMNAILETNATLYTIYDNMNCMLRLLKMETFKPPELSVPEWENDEFIERIMEVDDSEIKAINRRKKKAEAAAVKKGRLLLWSVDFWVRALIVMMDGVLEKLWEEEIKKEIPVPEFITKKEPTEYTLEDQKALKNYEESCRLLKEDRKKYLRILMAQDITVNDSKNKYILKLNEQVTTMMITKLKYDFCVKHVRIRNINLKLTNYKKVQWINRITILRADIEKISDYISRYTKFAEVWNKAVEDLKVKTENLILRERSIDRQFRNHFVNALPQHMVVELNKAYKKRPKLSAKSMQSILICRELASRVNSKTVSKNAFPLPKEVYEYIDGLAAQDDNSNMPSNLDQKQWEIFIKARRQKIETELKVKASNLQMADTLATMNFFNKELGNLKGTKQDVIRKLQESQENYIKLIHDQRLELRLTMGQVELTVNGSLDVLQNCILMHVDDINDINALILKVGESKLKAMHRVARFRRKVIFREWEHQIVSANIEYLKYMLHVIEKCNVTMEFLNIIRNWDRVRANKQKMLNTVGLIERAIEEKQLSFRRQLERLNTKIIKVREKIEEMKKSNKSVNRQIEQVKVDVAFCTTNRDTLVIEKRKRENNEKMEKLKKRSQLVDTIRRDYAHIMELKTLLELQRLRTFPTLGPNPDQCLK